MSNALKLTFALVIGLGFSLLPQSCLERHRDDSTSELARCTACHGDASRPGSAIARAAPPRDLLGAEQTGYPGVGAHSIHLQDSETHTALPCSECHIVPERVDSKGHTDDAAPAEVVFGSLAKTGGAKPHYDRQTRTCVDTYCHRDADAVWTHPKTSEQACGSCHDLPPAPPHPQSQQCGACHGDVASSLRQIIAPELHVNGQVEVTEGDCSKCHGSAGNPAPPPDTEGNTQTSALGVGAHQIHLSGGNVSRAVLCEECHRVPEKVGDPEHVDEPPAEVLFSGVSTTADRTPLWDRETRTCTDSWCHGPSTTSSSSPVWTEPSHGLDCTSCHGVPPALPHPQQENCALCHGDVVDEAFNILAPERHVDGVIDLSLGDDCTTCHGSENPAPPLDLSGQSDTSNLGVGAHQIHVLGSDRARAVPCDECHLVPDQPIAPGHFDSAPPAEVTFAGAALAYGASPEYDNGTCLGTPCHGAAFPEGHDSGGTHTEPVWNLVDGSQVECGSCHGLPPPRPHPYGNLNPTCAACHEDITADNVTFRRPELHVDGRVTFELP